MHTRGRFRARQAQFDLGRTEVRSTLNGYVSTMLLRMSDYANKGAPNIAIIDADSLWVTGYFEEK